MSKFLLPLAAISVLAIPVSLSGQSTSTLMSAGSQGMAYASSCNADEWSLFNNTAGLASVEQPVASFSYQAVPSFRSFNKIAAVAVVPLKSGAAGVGLFRFGDELYNEQIAAVGYSNTFGLASLGARLNYIQYYAEGYGTKRMLSVNFGGIARITPQLSVGTYITNLNQPELSRSGGERLPVRLTAGISLSPSQTVTIVTELEKDLDHKPVWRTGLDYKVNKKFSARTGFSLHPDAMFFGFGFNSGKLTISYAFQYQTLLGSSHQATIGHLLKRKKK